MHHPAMEWMKLDTSEPLDPKDITERLRAALDMAEAFVDKMPTEKAGLLFLESGHVVEPIRHGWRTTKLTPGRGAANGRRIARSLRPCWSCIESHRPCSAYTSENLFPIFAVTGRRF